MSNNPSCNPMAQPIPQVIYLVERQMPPAAAELTPLVQKIKEIATMVLIALGLAIIAGATFALGFYWAGHLAVSIETLHSFFLTGVVCAVGGFHLIEGKAPPCPGITAGPLTLST